MLTNENLELVEFYDLWKNGAIEIKGVKHHRGWRYQPLQSLNSESLDGEYWRRWGSLSTTNNKRNKKILKKNC